MALRIPFTGVPLTADEGGYAEVARLWAGGHRLYSALWIDRPQGLIVVFRALLAAGITTTVGLRLAAAAFAAVLVVLACALGEAARGRLPAFVAGALAATAGASPFIEGFTLSGEVVASVLGTAAILAFLRSEQADGSAWLVVAGVAAGSAWMVKQSFFDAALAVLVCVWGSRRRAVLFAGAVCVPVAVGVLASRDPAAWYRDVIGYGLHASGGPSVLTHVHQLVSSVEPASKALLAAAVLAALGFRHAPKVARLWLVFAAAGVLVGGNFHAHYYLQLVVPLALVAACIDLDARRRVVLAAAASLAAVAFAVPLWGEAGTAQAHAVWPADRHLLSDAAVARYVAAHSQPSQRIYVMWAAADVYYLADRRPLSPYMWLRNVQSIDGAVAGIRRRLAAGGAELVVVEQPPGLADPSGRTAAVLHRHYRLVANIQNVSIYRLRTSSR